VCLNGTNLMGFDGVFSWGYSLVDGVFFIVFFMVS
jgi:hypothetical protein